MRLVCVVVAAVLLASDAAAQCYRTDVHSFAQPMTRSDAAQARALAAAASIQPINGVMLEAGGGMSNSNNLFTGLLAHQRRDLTLHPAYRFVNGAKSGQAAEEWAWTSLPWDYLKTQLAKFGFTTAQVQVFTVMVTNKRPRLDPETNAARFRVNVVQILTRAKALFPNLKMVRPMGNYTGVYDVGQDKTPEPHNWREQQVIQELQESYTEIPLAAMTVWSDGAIQSPDGISLECAHMTDAGVHLSAAGRKYLGGEFHRLRRDDETTRGWLRP